jgi:hypothetical protein
VAVGLPFAVHGVVILFRGPANRRKQVLWIGAGIAALASIHLLWQYAVTGDPLLNPYTLWWHYDTIGFGKGIGIQAGGYSLNDAQINLKHTLQVTWSDLLGWFNLSYIFLPFGLFALRKDWRAWLLSSVAPTLFLVYILYWIGSWLFGPRYYYEGIFSITLLTAAGIRWLAGFPIQNEARRPWGNLSRARFTLVTGLVAFLITCNLVYYVPLRVGGMHGLYGITLSQQAPFKTEQAQIFAPALVIIHPANNWTDYGGLIDMTNPFMNTPFLFTLNQGAELNQQAIAQFPDRRVYHFYTDTPDIFYSAPR